MKVLITSGGTKIKIDLVRSITNMSRGTFGSKIADAFYDNPEFYKDPENVITFLFAKDSRLPDCYMGVRKLHPIEYETFDDYALKLDDCLKEQPDIIVLAAAVSDYGVENPVNGKIRSGEELVIRLKPLPKLISTVRAKCPNAVLCGFKLLVNSTEEELKEAVVKSIKTNDCDLVVGNDLRDIKANNHRLMIGETNAMGIVFDTYGKDFNLAEIVAKRCIDRYNENKNYQMPVGHAAK